MFVMTKETRLNLRITDEFRKDIETLAAYHGLTMSSYAHSLLVRAIRREKEAEPEAFAVRNLAPVVATIGSPKAAEDAELRRQIQRGIDLAPTSEKKMPAKLEDKTNTIAKRKHSR